MEQIGEEYLEIHGSASGSTEKSIDSAVTEKASNEQNLEIDNGRNKETSDRDDIEKVESMEEIHSRIPREYIPVIGMEFKCEEEAYEFYNSYALKAGFGIRRAGSHFDKETNRVLLDRTFCCCRQGVRETDKRDLYVKAHRSESRCGCSAKMKINIRRTGKFQIEKFIAGHNHELSPSNAAHLFRSHRKISNVQAAVAQLAESSGIRPKETTEFMARQVGGRENLGYTHVDYKNHLRTKRTREMKLSDTGGVLEYLQGMKMKDSNFFYALQVDTDALITNIFWADARMMVDYSFFGDVVCFDTTYKKHKDGRPIALFVGVNHHKQSVIFGGALLYDETADTFRWLFNTFAQAMGKAPATVLTDEAAAIASALSSEWPSTHHRLCIWHIYQNAAINLSAILARFKEFAKDFSSCVYDCEEEEIFKNAWNEMLNKYNLHSNKWLKDKFNIKEKWALVYGREYFCADMTTTQRSESMNNVIKRYISYTYDMRRFFEHFQRLIDDRRDEELKADFKASQSSPSLLFPVQILKHAAKEYTPEVFNSFQIEWGKGHDCRMEVSKEDGMVLEYKITPYNTYYQQRTVSYDSRDGTIVCSCKKFEFSGILCSHALKVLTFRNITRIPDPYVLKRWSKKAKRGNMIFNVDNTSVLDPKAVMAMRYKELCQLCTRLVIQASETDASYKLTKNAFVTLLEKVDQSSEKNVTNEPIPTDNNVINLDDNINEENGIRISGMKKKDKVRGQPNKRLKNCLEKSKRKRKSTEKPKLCGVMGETILTQASSSIQISNPNLEELSFPSVMFAEEPNCIHYGHTDSILVQRSMGLSDQMQPFQTCDQVDLNSSWNYKE